MLISIITPTFNDFRFLEENIKSLLKQTYKFYEHIVIDGGSTDGTLELLKSYPHIKWISERDKGMYDAINKGIKMASGDIIAYLNADDRYFDYSLETVCGTFKQYNDVDFVYGYCTYIDEKNRPICTFRTIPFNDSIISRSRITWAQPSCFWRSSIHKKIGLFDASMKNAGDSDFFHRLILQGAKAKVVKKPLSKFMVREDCITKKLADNIKRERMLIHEKYSINKRRWRYALGEVVYYLANIDSYFFYVKNKYRSNKGIRSFLSKLALQKRCI